VADVAAVASKLFLSNPQNARVIPTLHRDPLIERGIRVAHDVQCLANARLNRNPDPNRQIDNASLDTNLSPLCRHIHQDEIHRAIHCSDVGGYVGMRCDRASEGKNQNEEKGKSTHGSSPELNFGEGPCHGSENLNVCPYDQACV
jgi:hypothetical protein